MRAAAEAIAAAEVVDASIDVDVDAADLIDDALHVADADARIRVHRLADDALHRIDRKADAGAGVAARITHGVRGAQRTLSITADLHPEVDRNRQKGRFSGRRLHGKEHQRLDPHGARAVGAGAQGRADQKDIDAVGGQAGRDPVRDAAMFGTIGGVKRNPGQGDGQPENREKDELERLLPSRRLRDGLQLSDALGKAAVGIFGVDTHGDP
jgi:hypothetical protein